MDGDDRVRPNWSVRPVTAKVGLGAILLKKSPLEKFWPI